MPPRVPWTIVACALLLAFSRVAIAAEDSPAQFYRNRQVQILVGSPPGGGYDTYARLLSRHMSRHIPGKPTLIVQNMPGASGLIATNYVYNVAPQDGTVLLATIATIPLSQALGNMKFDAQRLGWIGSANEDDFLCFARADGPIKTYADLFKQDMIIAAANGGGSTRDLASLEKNVLGARFKIVTGYPGGRDMALALEKGEVQGQCGVGWSALMAQRPNWAHDRTITLLGQESIKGLPAINAMGVPLVTSFAKTDEDREVLELVYAQGIMGRPYVVGRGVPADRLASLRRAFVDTLKDPEFRADAERAKLDLDYFDGRDLQALVTKLYAMPQRILDRAKQAMEFKP